MWPKCCAKMILNFSFKFYLMSALLTLFAQHVVAETAPPVIGHDYFVPMENYSVELDISYEKGAKLLDTLKHDNTDFDIESFSKSPCGQLCKKLPDCNIVLLHKSLCLALDCGLDLTKCFFISAKEDTAHSLSIIVQRFTDIGLGIDETGTTATEGSSNAAEESDPIQFAPSKNANNDVFDESWNSVQNSESVPQCEQPKVIGPCRAALPRYYFDSSTQKCEQFMYGGCRGNSNNFIQLEDCLEACGKLVDENESPEVGGTHGNEGNKSDVSFFAHLPATGENPLDAHRDDSSFGHMTSTSLKSKYELEAIVPLFMGVIISILLLLVITFRCVTNAKNGPKKFRKVVHDGPPPTIGQYYSEDEIINGMYT